MSSNIFHDYDIRGRYPSELNEAVFYNLGVAYWQVFQPGKIAIARDARLSSDTLFLYLASGLKKHGVKIIDLGRVSTPFASWYSRKYKIDSLMITASHNPKDFNGIKINSYRQGPIDKTSGLLKIKEKFDALEFSQPSVDFKKDIFKKHQPIDEYVKFYTGLFKPLKSKIKIVLDFSNGSSGAEYVKVLEKLGVNFATLNEAPNGNFPIHEPNPLNEKSHKSLKVLMKSKKFDMGALIDGDGDRVLFFDEKGEPIDPSYIMAMMVEHFADQKKNKVIVRNIALAKIIDEIGKGRGFKTIVTKVGYSHVYRAMAKYGAQVGGEKSGHYFFKEFFNRDTSLFAVLAVLKVLSSGKKSFSALLEPYKKYIIYPEINYPFEGKVDSIIGEIKDKFKYGKISELDGLSVDFPDHHFNLRKSNTENMWRLTLDGYSKSKMDETKRDVEKILGAK
jgi:phosphomannomutase